MANSGTTVKSFHRTIEESCLMDGDSFGLDYNTFLKAVDGYQDILSIDYKAAFTCITIEGFQFVTSTSRLTSRGVTN